MYTYIYMYIYIYIYKHTHKNICLHICKYTEQLKAEQLKNMEEAKKSISIKSQHELLIAEAKQYLNIEKNTIIQLNKDIFICKEEILNLLDAKKTLSDALIAEEATVYIYPYIYIYVYTYVN
jgi:hypothetical protein